MTSSNELTTLLAQAATEIHAFGTRGGDLEGGLKKIRTIGEIFGDDEIDKRVQEVREQVVETTGDLVMTALAAAVEQARHRCTEYVAARTSLRKPLELPPARLLCFATDDEAEDIAFVERMNRLLTEGQEEMVRLYGEGMERLAGLALQKLSLGLTHIFQCESVGDDTSRKLACAIMRECEIEPPE